MFQFPNPSSDTSPKHAPETRARGAKSKVKPQSEAAKQRSKGMMQDRSVMPMMGAKKSERDANVGCQKVCTHTKRARESNAQ